MSHEHTLVSWRRLLTACKPYIKNSVQIGAIYAAGDFTQQKLITKNEKYNLESTKNVTIVGGLMLSPLYVTWYNALEKFLPGTATKTVLKKLCVDQMVAGALGTCIFFVAMSYLENEKDIFRECREKAPTAFLCNTMYWPFLMFVIFKKVPVNYQPIAVACGDFIWSIFLCFYKMKDLHPEEHENTSQKSVSENSSVTVSAQEK